MKVHGVRLSPFVRKVLAVLEMKGLPYEVVDVMPGSRDPSFLAISPLGKIPGFEDGEVKLADSTVICEYLDDRYPQLSCLPADPGLRARARWYEEYADTRLGELLGGGVFFEKLVKPVIMKQQPDEARVQAIIDKQLPKELDYLESELPAEGFLCGEFGRADISVVTAFINAGYAGYHIDAARWPKLAVFIERVKQQPALAKPLAVEEKILPALTGVD